MYVCLYYVILCILIIYIKQFICINFVQTLTAEIEQGIIKSCKLKTDHSTHGRVHELSELNGKIEYQ